MDLRARHGRDADALADADRLDRGDRHHGLREAPIELAVPLDVRAESGRQASHDDLERAAEGVASGAGGVDGLDHLLLHRLVHAVQRRLVVQGRDLLVGDDERIADASPHRA